MVTHPPRSYSPGSFFQAIAFSISCFQKESTRILSCCKSFHALNNNKILPAYDHELQVVAVRTSLCGGRNKAQLRAGLLVCRKSWKVPGLARLPERVGIQVPTGKEFRQMLGQSRAVMGR